MLRATRQVVSFIAEHTRADDKRALTLYSRHKLGQVMATHDTSLKFVPSMVSTWFKYDDSWLRFSRNDPRVETAPNEESHAHIKPVQSVDPDITISCVSLFGNAKPVKIFLEQILQQIKMVDKDEPVTLIYRCSPYETEWYLCRKRTARQIDAVVMDQEIKVKVVDKIKNHLLPSTKKW